MSLIMIAGKVAEALVANAPALIVGGPQINKAEVLASKVCSGEAN